MAMPLSISRGNAIAAPANITASPLPTSSTEQKTIIAAALALRSGEEITAEASAGSGKTTTLRMVHAECCTQGITASAIAFNRHSVEDFKSKGVPARTLHSAGLNLLRLREPQLAAFGKPEKYILSVSGFNVPFDLRGVDVSRFYDFLRGSGYVPEGLPGFGLAGVDGSIAGWRYQMLDSGIKNIERFEKDAADTDIVEFAHYFDDLMRQSIDYAGRTGACDYPDMIWRVIALKLEPFARGNADILMLDEAQDLSRADHAVIGQLAANGRTLWVGDRAQSLYGWRQAVPEVFAKKVAAGSLPLSISRRCSHAVVDYVSSIFGHIKAADDAHAGVIHTLASVDYIDRAERIAQQAKPGDMVIAFRNGDLTAVATALLAKGTPIDFSLGDDSPGASMKKALGVRDDQIRMPYRQLSDDWFSSAEAKLRHLVNLGKLDDAAEIADLGAAIEFVESTVKRIGRVPLIGSTVSDFTAEVTRIFSSRTRGAKVRISTIHRAKGLEPADGGTVFWLTGNPWPYMPKKLASVSWPLKNVGDLSPEELRFSYGNCLGYVAATRAKERLVIAHDPDTVGARGRLHNLLKQLVES